MNDPYCVNCAFLKTCTKYPNKNIYYMYCANHSSTIADNEALANLTNAIAEAIVKGKSQAEVWASDGEGYSIRIKRVEDELDNKAWNQLPNHYTAEWHFHSTKGCINPQQFWNE